MSKTKVTLKLDNLKQKIRTAVKQLKEEKFADTVKDVIVGAVRKEGINPKTGRKFKSLSKSTITHRKYLAKYNKTHPEFSPSKSNLTITGRLLDSIRARISAKSNRIVFRINVSGNHKRYRGKNGLIGTEQTNQAIRGYLAEQGRDPLGLNDKSKGKIIRLLTLAIRERLK
tara:strand:+ start:5462 stop:5974 length:513 start_codon:yes stop_codon:yes gene_type:complete